MNSYWDTSALIPCFVSETATVQVRKWLEEEGNIARFTSWLTVFEFEMVLRKKLSTRLLTSKEYEKVHDKWSSFQSLINFVPLDNKVATLGTRLQKIYGLLSGDSIQLGSASLLQLDQSDLRFVCLDQKLAQVARRERFHLAEK